MYLYSFRAEAGSGQNCPFKVSFLDCHFGFPIVGYETFGVREIQDENLHFPIWYVSPTYWSPPLEEARGAFRGVPVLLASSEEARGAFRGHFQTKNAQHVLVA